MAELADALDSGSSLCKEVQVQVLLPAPKQNGSAFALPFCFGVDLTKQDLNGSGNE